ncbi:MAG: hypothetical protein K2Q45_06535 [Nitrosomonas sp.]|nr:hypothetical protein [Nitrosomonas sp.]
MNGNLVGQIANLFALNQDQEAERLLQKAADEFFVLTAENESLVFLKGIERIEWWRKNFEKKHPLTYERLNRNIHCKANAIALVGQPLWKNLIILHLEAQQQDHVVFDLQDNAKVVTQITNEFGTDTWHILNGDSTVTAMIGTQQEVYQLQSIPSNIWSIPYQNAFLVEMNDILYWIASNRQNSKTLGETSNILVLVTSTQGRSDKAVVQTTVTLRQRQTLIFDVYRDKPLDVWEAKTIPMVSACNVLDQFMLYASSDGVLRAHPRSNPNSMYYVEDMESLVSQMTSLYNVVAFIYKYDLLEVRRVTRQEQDPFFSFEVVLQKKNVDNEYPPLLYGPYVIYRALDGKYMRTLYDNGNPNMKQTQVLPIRYKPGWTLERVKNANWHYWTVVMKDANGRFKELFLPESRFRNQQFK